MKISPQADQSLFAKHSISAHFIIMILLLLCGCANFGPRVSQQKATPSAGTHRRATWWKGSLHAHSFRSDGDTFPELVADWYKRHGYHFLSITDHVTVGNYDKMTSGPLMMDRSRATTATLNACAMRFGKDWITYSESNGKPQIVLKDQEQFRGALEEPGRFLLLSGEEISGGGWGMPVHVNAINFMGLIHSVNGSNVLEVLQQILKNIDQQRRETGRQILAQVNHPNFGWALTAEDIAPLDGAQLIEIFNGILLCSNRGNHNGIRPSNERIWDIVLTKRLAELGKDPIFGVATDDAHNYHEFHRDRHNPGRGWIMVRAPRLTNEAIVGAIDKGDFYASTGVSLQDIRFSGKKIQIEIQPEQGVTYKTQFIGTRKSYDPASEAITQDKGLPIRTTRRYSEDIGQVLGESESFNPSYVFKGDEIYVRARIVSSDITENPIYGDDYKTAWTQPFIMK